MITASPRKAKRFFEAKMQFTTGPAELKQMIDGKEDFNIIDVRASEDYQAGHIPGAINLQRAKWSSRTGLSKEKPNVIYCYSETCHLAATAAVEFSEHGFPIVELEGGFEGWQHYNFPIET